MSDYRNVLAEQIMHMPLIDHHVHGTWQMSTDRAGFEDRLNEASPEPIPTWMTQFDSQVGLAVRAYCSPLLDLEPHTPADDYWMRRSELGENEVTRRMLDAAGVEQWIIETGHASDLVLSPEQMTAVTGVTAHEVVRVEAVAETLALEGVTAGEFADTFEARLHDACKSCVGFKTIVAYRVGFDLDWTEPDGETVRKAAAAWIGSGGGRLDDPVLIKYCIFTALRTNKPLQFHVGFGDRDLDLLLCNPLLLVNLMRQPVASRTPIMLLHCYPYHREAGYLSQAFTNVYCDVGLGLNYVGSQAPQVLAESLEMPPFARVLYSSDGWGPAELHFLGARLWRRSVIRFMTDAVADGSWSLPDALRLTEMMARHNARRVYALA